MNPRRPAFLAPAALPARRLPQFAKTPRRLRHPGPSCRAGGGPPRIAALPAAAYAAYLPYIFALSSAHAPGLPEQNSLLEAAQLSLNFDYVLPLALPAVAPVVHPAFEAIFSVTVAYAALLVGFAADAPGAAGATGASADANSELETETDTTSSSNGVDVTTLAALAVPFLTNIIWLPYLALRPSLNPPKPPSTRPALLIRISQSPFLPLYAVATVLASVPYLLYARAETYAPGVVPRLAELSRLVHDNILANSFAADLAAFALFQAWLVPDDAAARGWTGARAARAITAARVVPFFGLAWYLFERARDPAVRQF